VSGERRRRALRLAIAANATFVVVEVAGGLAFSSLALLADAAHLVTDVTALALALAAEHLSRRPPSHRHSFGLERAEVLGALASAVLLLGTAAAVLVAAVQRLGDPFAIVGEGLLAVAVAGLAVNAGSAVLLARARGASLNLRGAHSHMLADAAGSVAAIVSGVAVVAFSATWVDPLVSLLLGAAVARTGWRLLRDTVHVLLEGTPPGLDPGSVEGTLRSHPAVASVHHVHVWNLSSDLLAMSAHVLLRDVADLHEAQLRGGELKELLAQRHGIAHATLELECHVCDPAGVVHVGSA
jgi:cobalt-zinc-cadmium efflux system protein